jgi:RimJ/RimL family protein N-acetyltransferase
MNAPAQRKIRLEPFAPSHFPLLRSWFASEREVVLWGGTALFHPLSDAQCQAMLDESRQTPPQRRCWMAYAGDVVIGHGQLAMDWRNGIARVSRFVIAPTARGQGWGRALLDRVVTEAFAESAVERVELNVYANNPTALALYLSYGFVQEGTRRSSALVGNERWDTIMMSLLRSERPQPALVR